MSFFKKGLFVGLVFIVCLLLFAFVASAKAPLKRADVMITGKYSKPITFDKRLSGRKFRRTGKDGEQLKNLFRPQGVSDVPYRITTSGGSFYISAKTAVIKDGAAVNLGDLPVPCAAYVFFYQSPEGSIPGAVKIVVNKVGEGASQSWRGVVPEQLDSDELFPR